MKKALKAIALGLAVALLGTALAACGGGGATSGQADAGTGKPTEITFWTQDTSTWMGYFDAAVKEFETANPDVKVKVEYFPEFAQKTTQAFAAGQEPDVVQTWQGVADWASAGKIAQVPEDVFSAADFEKYFYESALKNKIYEDKYFCVPTEINVEAPTLYVNMDILKAENVELPEGWIENNGPKSWSELYEFAASLTQKEGDMVLRSGLAYVYGTWEANFLSTIWQLGGDYRDEANKQVHFNTPEAKQAAELMLKYCSAPDAISDSGGTRYDLFIQGTAAMCVGAPWFAGSFGIDSPDMNYQCFNMPAFVDGADPIAVATGGWGYIVSEKCANKDAAWRFVKFMSSAEQVGNWAYQTGALPSRNDALEELTFDPNVGSVDKAIAITREILPFAQEDGAYTLTPSTLVYTIVREQMRQMLETGDIDTALATMETEGNRMIEENLNR